MVDKELEEAIAKATTPQTREGAPAA